MEALSLEMEMVFLKWEKLFHRLRLMLLDQQKGKKK